MVCSVLIDAPLREVWAAASDLASHAEWMADAETIAFEGEQRAGVGTRLVVATRVGPFRTNDVLEVTAWVEGAAIAVTHHGVVRGTGRFELTPMEGATRFRWSEDLWFPPWLGGPVTALLARPILTWVWRRNLAGLKRRLESERLSGR